MFDQTLKSPSARPVINPIRSGGPRGSAAANVASGVPGVPGVPGLIDPPLSAIPVLDDRGNAPRARGFAAMDKDRQRQIASAGGRAAHECGNAHEFTSEEARSAGRKGGMSISQNREHMASIGSKGGLTRGERQRERVPPSV
jgi:general stress protein YciG